ncbi:lipopolysaccharide biosynthesis protein [Micromonospora sp. BRA006-A]|nr:lipopolysaccharide biosynthesis protein [Micromonospora sp. BRA006-A]
MLALTLLCGAFTGVLAERRPPVYRAETQMLVTFAAEKSAEPAPPAGRRGGPADAAAGEDVRHHDEHARLTRPVIGSLDCRTPPTTWPAASSPRPLSTRWRSTWRSPTGPPAPPRRSPPRSPPNCSGSPNATCRPPGSGSRPTSPWSGRRAAATSGAGAVAVVRPRRCARWPGRRGRHRAGTRLSPGGTPVSADVRALWATTVRRHPADAVAEPAGAPGQSDGRVSNASVKERQTS